MKDRCPRLPSIAVINIMINSNSWRKGFFSAFSFQFKSPQWGEAGAGAAVRNLKGETEAEAMEEHRTSYWRSLHGGCFLPQSRTARYQSWKWPHRFVHSPSWWRRFWDRGSQFPDASISGSVYKQSNKSKPALGRQIHTESQKLKRKWWEGLPSPPVAWMISEASTNKSPCASANSTEFHSWDSHA